MANLRELFLFYLKSFKIGLTINIAGLKWLFPVRVNVTTIVSSQKGVIRFFFMGVGGGGLTVISKI